MYGTMIESFVHVEVASFVRRLATAEAVRIGLYSVWPPLRRLSTASLTIVVWGVQLLFRAGSICLQWASFVLQLRLPRDHNSSDIPKRYTGARDTTFARARRK